MFISKTVAHDVAELNKKTEQGDLDINQLNASLVSILPDAAKKTFGVTFC